MKPPYAIITGKCDKHGAFTVERKPKSKAGQPDPSGTGALITKYPTAAVVCPKCRMWAKIVVVVEVLDAA